MSLLALSLVLFCSLVCVQYNTQKRKRWKSGEKRRGPGNTYVKPSPNIVYGTLFEVCRDSIKSGVSSKVITTTFVCRKTCLDCVNLQEQEMCSPPQKWHLYLIVCSSSGNSESRICDSICKGGKLLEVTENRCCVMSEGFSFKRDEFHCQCSWLPQTSHT